MKRFAALYDAIDASTGTLAKVRALSEYFERAPAEDAAWTVAFLTGRRPKRLVRATDLRTWAAELADIPAWLFEESYAQVGDLAETISLLVPDDAAESTDSFSTWVNDRLLPLKTMEREVQREELRRAWRELNGTARFVFNKLLTGSFRVGVSSGLVVRALAAVSGVPADVVAHRLMGQWEPSAEWFRSLLSPDTTDDDWSRPYPFYLAHALEGGPESLGALEDWWAEWKWDGIRAQLMKRNGRVLLWSRGEELLTGRFPEVESTAEFLPDGTVIDGELLAWRDGRPMPFSALQRRLNRKTVGRTLLADVPVQMVAYDCLEHASEDVRGAPLTDRRAQLTRIVDGLPTGAAITLSPLVTAEIWQDLAAAREGSRAHEAEGLMLKRRASSYGVGRKVGDWWKWKVDPLSVDAVLVYAQAGHGRRAGLYTDYTFAVWDDGKLVPFAKAYSGLTDAEIRQVDRFVQSHTREKYGPVRTVDPELVFELAFEGIQESPRHKSGIAVRFPRIARWRKDKVASDADSLAMVRALLHAQRGKA